MLKIKHAVVLEDVTTRLKDAVAYLKEGSNFEGSNCVVTQTKDPNRPR